MSVYRTDYTILSSDVDPDQQLRLSRLFTLLQEMSIAHTIELGMGREKTLDRGLLWIVTLQQVQVHRLPLYDEQVKLSSWPGDTLHLYFPRYYRMEAPSGELLLEGSALWALMDERSRRIVFPEEHGIRIRGERTGQEPPLPAAPRAAQGEAAESFRVPRSYCDINGHMNNTRYFDLAEDRLPEALRRRPLSLVRAEYSGEAREGESIQLTGAASETSFSLSGDKDRKLFRLNLLYT